MFSALIRHCLPIKKKNSFIFLLAWFSASPVLFLTFLTFLPQSILSPILIRNLRNRFSAPPVTPALTCASNCPACPLPTVPEFTEQPSQLQGYSIHTRLSKGPRGFGFNIVGGSRPREFLQVYSVTPGGPPALNTGSSSQGYMLAQREWAELCCGGRLVGSQ